jgi:hypothetical protein
MFLLYFVFSFFLSKLVIRKWWHSLALHAICRIYWHWLDVRRNALFNPTFCPFESLNSNFEEKVYIQSVIYVSCQICYPIRKSKRLVGHFVKYAFRSHSITLRYTHRCQWKHSRSTEKIIHYILCWTKPTESIFLNVYLHSNTLYRIDWCKGYLSDSYLSVKKITRCWWAQYLAWELHYWSSVAVR